MVPWGYSTPQALGKQKSNMMKPLAGTTVS